MSRAYLARMNARSLTPETRLRLLRILLRLSQDELARRAGLNQSTICRMERGYSRPTPRVLAAIERVLEEEAEGQPTVDIASSRAPTPRGRGRR